MMHAESLPILALLGTAMVALRLFVRLADRRVSIASRAGSPIAELWVFFRQWLARPFRTAAILPSSRFLNRCMVRALPAGPGRIIELGAGTGALTRALLDHGVPAKDLMAVEFNADLHQYLSRRFPGLAAIRADARVLGKSDEVAVFARTAPVRAVVSGLGMLSMNRETQRAVLAGAFGLMPEGGSFIQFTYGPCSPVSREVARTLGLRARRHGFTLRNLPPASVYVYTREPLSTLTVRVEDC